MLDHIPAGQVLAILVLLCFSGFFSGSETAIFSLPLLKRRRLMRGDSFLAKQIRLIFNDHHRVLMTILLGNTIVNVLASSQAEMLLSRVSEQWSVLLSLLVMTPLLVLFGEITPKILGLNYAEFLAPVSAIPLMMLQRILGPVERVLGLIVNRLERLLGTRAHAKTGVSEADLERLVHVGRAAGELNDEEVRRVKRFMQFREQRVSDILTPRTQVIAVPADATIPEVLEVYRRNGFSRMPVYDGTLDNVVGILHAKDLLALSPEAVASTGPANYVAVPLFVPFSRTLRGTMRDMRERVLMLAVVLDEHGGVAGIVTMEDLLEEIVGDIYDVLDEDESYILSTRGKRRVIKAEMPIEQFNHVFGAELSDKDFESIGGYIVSQVGHVPRRQETVVIGSLLVTVLRASEGRLLQLQVKPVETAP